MLAEDDFSVWATWRIPAMSSLLRASRNCGSEARRRRLEGAQDALEEAALAGRVELAQALQRVASSTGSACAHRAVPGKGRG